MLLQRDHDIQASAPLRRLRGEQKRSVMPLLQHETGRRALRIGVAEDDALPPLSGIAWTRLWLTRNGYHGDVRAHANESLPFIDEAFDVVWLQHALEPAPHAAELMAEACRVLAPGGALVVTALHPFSGWALWFYWRARGQRQTLRWPWRLRLWLRREGMQIERLYRLGTHRPGEVSAGDNRWGGAYLLLARKRRRAAIPLKLRPLPAHAPVAARLSPGARRHSVS